MGLGELVEEVRSAGEAESQKIRQEAEAEAKAIRKEAEAEAQATHQKWMDRAREEAEAEKRRILASAELEAKKLRLDAEANVLQAVRDAVEDRLANLPDDERRRITRSLVEQAGLPDEGRAWARKDDQELVQDLGYEYAGELDGPGGLVVEDPRGETREDLRFETILDETWRGTVRDVAADLFGK